MRFSNIQYNSYFHISFINSETLAYNIAQTILVVVCWHSKSTWLLDRDSVQL